MEKAGLHPDFNALADFTDIFKLPDGLLAICALSKATNEQISKCDDINNFS